jgi:ferredoxin-NADP reductase
MGYLTPFMLERHLADAREPLYYLAGPAPMIRTVREALHEAGIDDDGIADREICGLLKVLKANLSLI